MDRGPREEMGDFKKGEHLWLSLHIRIFATGKVYGVGNRGKGVIKTGKALLSVTRTLEVPPKGVFWEKKKGHEKVRRVTTKD